MIDTLLRFSNGNRYILDVFITQDLKIYVKFLNATKVKKIIGIVERLRLRLPARHCFAQALAGGRSSNRLTVNVIRNQQRNRRTLDATNIPSPQAMCMILLNSSVCPSRAGTGRGGEASLVV